MDSSALAVNRIYKINVWDSYVFPAGWRKCEAVFLGEQDGIVSFLVFVRGEEQTRNLDDTLTEYNLAVDHWAVYSDRAEFVAEKAGRLHFINTLGVRKTSYLVNSTEGQHFVEIARNARLMSNS